MRQTSTTGYVTLGGLLVLTVVVVMAAGELKGLGTEIETLVRRNLEGSHEMQTLTEDVTRPSGQVTKVTTTRAENESIEDFIKRHDDVVAYLKAN